MLSIDCYKNDLYGTNLVYTPEDEYSWRKKRSVVGHVKQAHYESRLKCIKISFHVL